LDVSFTNSLDSSEDRIIKSSSTYKRDKDWNEIIPKARVIVKADNFYDAVMDGIKRIFAALSFISFRNDLSFIVTPNLEFKNSLFNSRIYPTMKIFSNKELDSVYSLFYDLNQLEKTMDFRNASDNYFTRLEKFKRFFPDNPNAANKNNPIALSIQWLALAIQAKDPVVKLINLWNSLEFAVSGLSIQKEFSKSELKIVENQTSLLFEDLKRKGILDLSLKHLEILWSKLSHLNDPPILEKIQTFVQVHKIPFSENEMRIIRETRRKRNNIQHGKGNVTVKENELEKIRSLTEGILLLRADETLQSGLV
jgi:hypothetical protein